MKKTAYRSVGVPPTWLRGTASIEDGWVSIRKQDAETYWPVSTLDPRSRVPPGQPRALVFALAGALTPTAIVEFASNYGLLTHGPDAEELREPVEEFKAHANLLRTIIALNKSTREAAEGGREHLKTLRALAPMLAQGFEAEATTDDELLIQASVAIGRLVSEQLKETPITIEAACLYDKPDNAPGVFELASSPPTLLAWAYFQLVRLLVSRQRVTICTGCESIFVPNRPNQTFCEPACSAKYRNRNKYRRDRGLHL